MNQFVPIFLGQTKCPYTARPRRRHPEMHPRRRQAQRPRRRRPRHLSPHLFRDARQLELRRLFQEGSHRLGVGTRRRRSGNFPPQRLYATVYSPDKSKNDPSEFRPGSLGFLGRKIPQRRPRSQSPHRQRQQEGQFLDDGRNRPVRSVLRTARGPDARRRHQRHAGQQRRRPLHRNLEPGLHPVQRQSRRHVLAAARQARGHRHGLRARHQHHSGHEGLHRFRQRENFQLRDRHFPPDFRRAGKIERQEIRQFARCPKSDASSAVANTGPQASRSTWTSPSASSPTTSAR